MNEYIILTTEGTTLSPNHSDVENCQLLSRIEALNVSDAHSRLLEYNKWIIETGYSTEEIIVNQVITKEQVADIKAIVGYLWNNEKLSYEKEGCPIDHIYMVLKRLKGMIADY